MFPVKTSSFTYSSQQLQWSPAYETPSQRPIDNCPWKMVSLATRGLRSSRLKHDTDHINIVIIIIIIEVHPHATHHAWPSSSTTTCRTWPALCPSTDSCNTDTEACLTCPHQCHHVVDSDRQGISDYIVGKLDYNRVQRLWCMYYGSNSTRASVMWPATSNVQRQTNHLNKKYHSRCILDRKHFPGMISESQFVYTACGMYLRGPSYFLHKGNIQGHGSQQP